VIPASIGFLVSEIVTAVAVGQVIRILVQFMFFDLSPKGDLGFFVSFDFVVQQPSCFSCSQLGAQSGVRVVVRRHHGICVSIFAPLSKKEPNVERRWNLPH
jgi:hypothetical protein